jgi:hypothetical protein
MLLIIQDHSFFTTWICLFIYSFIHSVRGNKRPMHTPLVLRLPRLKARVMIFLIRLFQINFYFFIKQYSVVFIKKK